MTDFERLGHRLEQALLSLDHSAAGKILLAAGAACTLAELVENVVVPALQRIGTGWERGDVALSQVYMSGRMCEELVNTILPPGGTARENQPRIAIAVLEDHHVLGKRIVCSVLRAAGFELLDYGHGVGVDDLVGRVKRDRVRILLISTLMLPSALKVKELREKLNIAGGDVRIVVGGAPFLFDERLLKDVGADAMGKSASEAVTLVANLIEGLP